MSNKLLSEQELRKAVTEIKDRLAGRIKTHRDVGKASHWTYTELEQVIKEDGWIFEDEMLALIEREKLAWADYIIGEDADADGAKTDRLFYSIEGGNIVRKFQRQRNNLNATSGEEK